MLCTHFFQGKGKGRALGRRAQGRKALLRVPVCRCPAQGSLSVPHTAALFPAPAVQGPLSITP